MGVVFEAEHLALRRRVALKFLHSDVLQMPDAVERFAREARASSRLRGPHVVRFIDVDTDGHGRPFIVMDLLRGHDLEAELQARGALPIAEAVDLVLQTCAAVAEAHAAGVIHRDLKPSNLFLAEEDGARLVKVLDFGISKVARDEPAVTSPAVTLGTPLYMSPEQLRCTRDVDGRTDIWSLGVILYELLTGAPPFLGSSTAAIAAIVSDGTPSPRQVRPEISEGLERAVMTALAKCPNDRFPSVEALAAALMPFQGLQIASSAMAMAPPGPHAIGTSEQLTVPPASGPTLRTPREPPRGRSKREMLRALAASAAIAFALAFWLMLGTRSRAALAEPRALAPAVQETAAIHPLVALHPATVLLERDDTSGDIGTQASLPPPRVRGLTAAARPRPMASPNAAVVTHNATNAAPPEQRGRATLPHAPPERPLYL